MTTMPDRSIAFSAPLVPLVAAGTKTQTRRLLTACDRQYGYHPYSVGDVLRVKEQLGRAKRSKGDGRVRDVPVAFAWYAADDSPILVCAGCERAICACGVPSGPRLHAAWRWKNSGLPSRFCPAWASRYRIEVTALRVERLRDITDDDAKAEGFPLGPVPARITIDGKTRRGTACAFDARAGFLQTWAALHGHDSVASNPLVRVVTFRRVWVDGTRDRRDPSPP